MEGNENGHLLKKINSNGPYKYKEIDDPGNKETGKPTGERTQTYDDLYEEVEKQVDADAKAVNQVLLGLPNVVYALLGNRKNAHTI